MKVLYLIDPNSNHDVNWIINVSTGEKKYVVYRKQHKPSNQLLPNVVVLGPINDFSIIRPIRTFKSLLYLNQVIQKHSIEIFHIMYAEPNALWALVKLITKVKCIITTRGTDILKTIPEHFAKNTIQNYYVKLLYSCAFSYCDFVTCTSEKQREILASLFGKVKVQIIRTGIDKRAIEQNMDNRVPKALNGFKYIFFPRNMKPIYDHELALNAIAELPSRIRESYKFVFIDKDGEDKKYIERIYNAMKSIEASFVFLPKLNFKELIPTYSNSQIVIHTPKSDGSPVSAMEAMFCKIPVILPDLTYDSSIFSNCSFYISNNARSLAYQIHKNVKSRNMNKVETCYHAVRTKANREVEMLKLLKIYKVLLESNN